MSSVEDKDKTNKKLKTLPPRPSTLQETRIMNVVTYYFKLAGIVLGTWLAGYFNFSPSWLLLGLVGYVWQKRYKARKALQVEIGREAVRDERASILARIADLPSWVIFPDVERAEWINKILSQMWPYVGDYVKTYLTENVEPMLRQTPAMQSFKFTKMDLGDIPPRIGGIKVYTNNVKRDEIVMDLELQYNSDSDFQFSLKGIPAGIKELQLRGTMRVVFKPLIGVMPMIGGMSVFFLNNPEIDFNLTQMANALEAPFVGETLRTVIEDYVANMMVLPNRMPFTLANNIDLNKLKYPLPQGVLRIYAIGARDLKKADIGLMGKGKSDPYAIIKVGAQKFTTRVINNTVKPEWNQVYEAIIDEKNGQYLEMEIRDEDPGNKDDYLGRCNIEIGSIEDNASDSWLPLEDVKTGLVHVRLQWLYLIKNPLELDKQLESEKDDETISSCILIVYVDSARDLPRSKKSLAEPCPYVQLSVGHKAEETLVKQSTTEPRWEESFRFLVHNPNFQDIDISVEDKKSNNNLGKVSIPLKSCLTAPDMTLDQRFDLKDSGTTSQITLRLCLRVLSSEANAEMLEECNEEVIITPDVAPPANESAPNTNASASASPSSPAPVENGEPVVNGFEVVNGNIVDDSMSSGGDTPERGTELRKRKEAQSNSAGEFSLGRMQITIRYSGQRQKLIAVIHKCVNLIPCDDDNLADPYIKIYLLPDKTSNSKRKTQVVKNNLNPVFDETFEFSVAPDDLPKRTLSITVKNQHSMFSSSRTLMGTVTVVMAEVDTSRALTEWFDLKPQEKLNTVDTSV